ncbi:MAG: VCBS repeat-containing protein [Pirellulales bacterium]|nr:VCBS repeat-containing protein [Pirellulales bacterium]
MQKIITLSTCCLLLSLTCTVWAAPVSKANRLVHLDEFSDPYYVGLETAKLSVPQWVGQPGVEAVMVLAIDDMRDVNLFETHLRPILKRLQAIDGRAPVSIMTNTVDPKHPQLQKWLKEGLSIEAHTRQHRCPCLQNSDLTRAKKSFDDSVDMISAIPGNPAVAYRMPCCDSMNSVSPRFFAEVFNKTTPKGNFLSVDTSVFHLFTSNDPAQPRELARDTDGQERFSKYIPAGTGMVNLIEDYPYPYVIGRLCWELPCLMPSDWDGQHRNKPSNPLTLSDWKAAIDALAVKQGLVALCFHPNNWIGNEKVVELVDYADKKHSGKVKFLSLAEVNELLTRNVLGGQPLRAANGRDNGAQIMDIDGDGYMDAIVANEKIRQTRIWSPKANKWITSDFPFPLVSVDGNGNRTATGARFGILQKNGMASVFIHNEKSAGLWHFDGKRWIKDPKGLDGLQFDGPVMSSKNGFDQGVRLRDLDGDGVCELIVGNDRQNGVFAWSDAGGWKKLPFGLPAGTMLVDAQGRDAGLRFVDIDEDGHDDVIFSNAKHYSLHVFSSMKDGWGRQILKSNRTENDIVPMIVRGDGTNNGAWFARRHMWVQNEDTGAKLPYQVDSRHYKTLLTGDTRQQTRSSE